MDATELGLPQYLFTETRDPDGSVTGISIVPDKLLDWSTSSYGDAIDKLCRKDFDRELEAIHAWEQARLLQLEEQWMTLENGVDDDAHEQQYDSDCEAVVREAEARRDAAGTRMAERKAAIEKLVQQASVHLGKHRPAPREESFLGYWIALAAVGAIAYTLAT